MMKEMSFKTYSLINIYENVTAIGAYQAIS